MSFMVAVCQLTPTSAIFRLYYLGSAAQAALTWIRNRCDKQVKLLRANCIMWNASFWWTCDEDIACILLMEDVGMDHIDSILLDHL